MDAKHPISPVKTMPDGRQRPRRHIMASSAYLLFAESLTQVNQPRHRCTATVANYLLK